ncbi:MAG: COR domain-containing protein [Nostoc sp. DedSLP03]|uniref:N-6 DNA methylase n=1 Tax=Nostoc sp. DedSLP03 TaxID=3075400 RepID=UPI002AD36D52|nr:COR domain-containing protein [Nostoc sp. DedSLP03]MDZ7968922.1 COR domain-containing protein [Nostoc sp. DedSLP03]
MKTNLLINSICDILRRSNCAGALRYVPEITWILFLRILDELEEQEAKAVEDNYIWSLEPPYRWRDWAAPQGTKRLELRFYESGRFMKFVNGDLIPYLRNLKNQPAATPRQKIISEVLSSTHQVHLDTEFHLLDVLDKVHEISLQGIDDIHIFHISQIYEELLLKMGEKGNDGGQFFTPREVIRVMVEAINPQIEQTIYDPSCGTGGFLAQSYEYMRSALGDEITGDQLETLKYCTFYGREKENLIFPIALVNLMLHGIDQPNLWHGNTLTKEGIYADLFAGAPSLFDIILTNPPFGGKEHKEVQAQFTYKTSASQVLFLQHVIDNLKPGGKCAIVLDNGVLFRTNETAFVQTKRKLLDDCDLWCILSLPPGTFFATGAGVKANILFFTRGKVTEKIWYYDLSDIKVTKRQPLTRKHFEDFLKLLPGRENSERSLTVSRAEIEAKNFNLIPPEISAKGIRDTVSYYLQLQKGEKKSLNEAKLLIVGQGRVGKTSLMKQIIGQSFAPDENKTEGINIQKWNLPIDNTNIQLNVWDFGGQEIMHATHQFFLTKRSLYLLVLDSQMGEEENRIEYWLKLIQSLGEYSPIIVVGNKRDEHPLDIDRRGLQIKYSNIKAFIETSCLNGQGIAELKQKIHDLIAQALTESNNTEENPLKHIRDPLPLSWFNVKDKLQLKSQEEDFISYETYDEICQTEGITEEKIQSDLIQLLHDLGIVLNYRDDIRLEDTNILNPKWVTSSVYRILNDNLLMTEFKGILDRNQLQRILNSKRYPSKKHIFIIDLMKKFELCFDMDGYYNEKFLIPDLLPKEEPYTGDWQNSLAFEYHYSILPSSIISRFIVRMNKNIHQGTYWRSGVILACENSIALIKADREDRKIVIHIQNTKSVKGDGRRFLAIIRDHFEAIHKTIPGLNVEQKVPLRNHPNILLDYQNLLDYEEMEEPFIIPLGLKERVNVKGLLDGIESEPDRQRRREDTTDQRNQHTHNYNFQFTQVQEQKNQEGNCSMSNINQYGFGDNVAGDKVMRDKIGTQINNSQNLAQAAKDIKELLDQLSQDYPNNTAMVGAKAIEAIDSNPTLKKRVVNALKEAGSTALEKLVDHPAVSIVIAGAKGFLDT